MWRIESGHTAVRSGDVRELCTLYEAPADVTEALAVLARATKAEGWWEEYSDVLFPEFGLYLDIEAIATSLTTYDPELIHGLLQTPEFHLAMTRAVMPEVSTEELHRYAQLLHARQETALHRSDPCQVSALIGPGALMRAIGPPDVMQAQRRHLLRLNRLDHIDIRVLPWEAGAHGALVCGAFTIMDFEDEADPEIVYLESLHGARYLESRHHVHRHRDVWSRLVARSVPLEEHAR